MNSAIPPPHAFIFRHLSAWFIHAPRPGAPGLTLRLCVALLVSSFAFSLSPLPSPAAAADPTYESYLSLWQRGEYQRALTLLSHGLEGLRMEIWPVDYAEDHALLLHSMGRLDEAIKEMESIVRRYPEPAFSVTLALFYRERGRLEDFQRLLLEATRQTQRRDFYAPAWKNALGVARLFELAGQDPKIILNSYITLWTDRMPESNAPYIAAGDLAYRKYSYDVAAEYYGKALEHDPAQQDALAGLAECYWKSEDPRVEETLQKLLALNPHHPRALAIQAHQLLDRGKAHEALDPIQATLAVNPNDLRSLGLLSAARFLLDDAVAVSATQARALAFNPHGAEVFTIPAAIIARHYRFAEAAAMLRRALAVDKTDHDAQTELAFTLLRLGQEGEGRALLEQAFKEDPYNVHAYNMLQALDAMAKFKTIRAAAFQIQLPEQEARLLGEEMTATLKTAIARYQTKYDVTLTTPVLVQMFDKHDEFMVRSIGLPGNTGHLGICFGRLLTMDSPRARPTDAVNWRDVLWHEFVHVITLQKTKNRMPRWLSEGISVYEETQGSPAWGEKLDPRFKPILARQGLPGLADIDGYFSAPKTQYHLIAGYFLAGQFVKFYIDRFGLPALRQALDAIAHGQDGAGALVAASHLSAAKLDAQFRQALESRCASLKNLPDIPLPVSGDQDATQTAVSWLRSPSAFTDAMREGARAAEAQKWDAAEKAFQKAHELFPEYDAEDAPLRQLAGIYEKQKNREKLKQTLQRIIAWDGTAFAECRELATMLKAEKNWDGAIAAARIAFEVKPFDVDNLRDWEESALAKGDVKQALSLVDKLLLLDKTHELDHRLEHAQLLARVGNRVAAKAETLLLLEEMPHYWEAQKLLLEIVEAPAAAQTPKPSPKTPKKQGSTIDTSTSTILLRIPQSSPRSALRAPCLENPQSEIRNPQSSSPGGSPQ